MKVPRGGKSRQKCARCYIVNLPTFNLTPAEELISHKTLREEASILNVSPLKDLRTSLQTSETKKLT